MKYNFDKVIDRSGTSAEKVEGLKHIWGRTDLIPLWVADMDFATAPFVTDAIRKRCENEVLGYTGKPDSYYNAIINWVKQRYDLIVTKEVINFVPGIVPGIGMAMNCFTQKGDKVMIQPPVYHPFAWVTTRNERTLVKPFRTMTISSLNRKKSKDMSHIQLTGIHIDTETFTQIFIKNKSM